MRLIAPILDPLVRRFLIPGIGEGDLRLWLDRRKC